MQLESRPATIEPRPALGCQSNQEFNNAIPSAFHAVGCLSAHPGTGLWLPEAASGSSRHHRGHSPGRPRAGGHAYRRWQVSLLSVARARPGWAYFGGLAAGCPDGRSGCGAEAVRRCRGDHQRKPEPFRQSGCMATGVRRTCEAAVLGTRADDAAAHARIAAASSHQPHCSGRGPLHLEVGAGIQTGLRRAVPVGRSVSRSSDCGIHCHRGPRNPTGHLREAVQPFGPGVQPGIRSSQHSPCGPAPLESSTGAAGIREFPSRTERHRLLPVPEVYGEDGCAAAFPRCRCLALPCRAGSIRTP